MEINRKFQELQEQVKLKANEESPSKISRSPTSYRVEDQPIDLNVDRCKLDKLYRQILLEIRPDEPIESRIGESLSMRDQERAHRIVM